jgi:hypothetical protein
MAPLSLKPPLGRPRRHLEFSPSFLERLRSSSLPGWAMATAGGWPHYPTFSAYLHQRTVPATAITVERFYRLADALGFPREEVFQGPAR